MSTPSDADASPDPANSQPAGDGASPEQGLARLRHPRSLERLRDRVQTVAEELARLREENAALRDRVEELETRPPTDPDLTTITFDEDPETLRRTVENFIGAIDDYLAETSPDG
ncbi:MAG: hypothetical protein GVY18_09505 [Bacteroidetes bacterium]|nr:hypothetical protein [Bacteroidota bacterium]